MRGPRIAAPPGPVAGPGVTLAALVALVALVTSAPERAGAQVPAAPDSLEDFLQGLADSTDGAFGAASVQFDTTGLDSILASVSLGPATGGSANRRPVRTSWFPILRFHRAEGMVAGAGVVAASPSAGVLEMRGSYGFENKGGRYVFGYRRTLWHPGRPLTRFDNRTGGRIGAGRRLDLEIRYARETVAFMPEHTDVDFGAVGAFISGDNAQSVYEMRGFRGQLMLWTGDWGFHAGYRNAKDRAMPLVTRWSLFGAEDEVPPNTLAVDESYAEPFGGIAFQRNDWELGAKLDARGGGSDRWRLRGVLGKAVRLGATIKSFLQIEAGAGAASAPRQRRFEIGGGKIISSLPYGVGGNDHLLAGKLEFIGSQNLLRAIGLEKPDWLVFHPMVFGEAAAVWNDPAGRDVVFSKPPSQSWRGSAGFGVATRIGFPEPDVYWRIGLAWPVGPESGELTLNFSLGRRFDLVDRL